MKKWKSLLAYAAVLWLGHSSVEGATIVYVPQDDRPVSLSYTVTTAEYAGYKVLTPPVHLISGSNFKGYPDEIWTWLEGNIYQADAVVLSTDTLIYGGLVDSRKHTVSLNTLERRISRLNQLRNKTTAPIYGFGTVMRSPRASGSGTEPAYYASFGPNIFRIAALQDKQDSEGLTQSEQTELFSLMATVPVEYLQDWFERRQKNMMVNRGLIDAARNHVFSYFALGHDDTSVRSQSAMEGRYLRNYSKGIPETEYGSFPGADQLGLLLIARAHIDRNQEAPTFSMIYPLGAGESTIPRYEDQTVGITIKEHISAVGGKVISSGKPDILLAVDTPLATTTGEAEVFDNFSMPSPAIKSFVDKIEEAIQMGVTVGVADVAFSNGANNLLMGEIERRKLIYKVGTYSGWNTASNSVGYAIAQAILSKHMDPEAHRLMLAQQYLDNWGYQANVRKEAYRMQESIRLDNVKYAGEITTPIREKVLEEIQVFGEKHLGLDPRQISATLPWNRLFETEIKVYDKPTVPNQREVRLKREAEEKARQEKLKKETEDKKKAEDTAKKGAETNGDATKAPTN